MKLDKQDKKILIWGFIIRTILNLFIYKSIDSAMMLGVLYFIHNFFKRKKEIFDYQISLFTIVTLFNILSLSKNKKLFIFPYFN